MGLSFLLHTHTDILELKRVSRVLFFVMQSLYLQVGLVPPSILLSLMNAQLTAEMSKNTTHTPRKELSYYTTYYTHHSPPWKRWIFSRVFGKKQQIEP